MSLSTDNFATYKLYKTELEKRGYTTTTDIVNGRQFVSYTAPNGESWSTFAANIAYPFATRAAIVTSVQKEKAYELAQSLDIEIPYTRYLPATEKLLDKEADSLVKRYDNLIVKPSNSSLSKGLTLNISDRESLHNAIDHARSFKPGIIIQEQVEGEEIRFAIVDGKAVAGLLRRTARVTGDGVSSVAELVARENEERTRLEFKYVSYPQLTPELIDEGFFEDTTILADGQILELNRATMIKNGCSVYDVLERVHPGYIEVAQRLASELGAVFAAVDIFIKDFTQSPAKGNYWFIEFNTSPVLKLFYGCRDGKMVDIVPMLADQIDTALRSKHEKNLQPTKIIGGFERVLFPDLHASKVIAKIDTGAYSGAIHCEFIETFRGKNGKMVLRYQPFSDKNEIIETTDYTKTYIRSSTGHRVKRIIIETEVDIAGERYIIRTGLSDRRDMQTQVLIGRRFLRAYNLVVDVSINEELDNDGGAKL